MSSTPRSGPALNTEEKRYFGIERKVNELILESRSQEEVFPYLALRIVQLMEELMQCTSNRLAESPALLFRIMMGASPMPKRAGGTGWVKSRFLRCGSSSR